MPNDFGDNIEFDADFPESTGVEAVVERSQEIGNAMYA